MRLPLTSTRPAPIHWRASVREPRPAFESTRSSVLIGRLDWSGADFVSKVMLPCPRFEAHQLRVNPLKLIAIER